ncbi:MAG: DUF1667 domain-containing protein [Brevinematales bacterium]
MKRELYCLRCPRGCLLQIEISGSSFIVSGNSCKLGEEFAIQEIQAPRRLFTSSVQVRGGKFPVVPVITSSPVLKDDIPKWIRLCQTITLEAPIQPNTTVVRNPFGDGIDLVATWFA